MERKELKEEKKREKRSCMPAFTGRKEKTEENAHWLECKDDITENGDKRWCLLVLERQWESQEDDTHQPSSLESIPASPVLPVNFLKLGNESLSYKVWSASKGLLLLWALGRVAVFSYSVHHSPVGLLGRSPAGCQSQVFGRLIS